jgi:hypothetical protein
MFIAQYKASIHGGLLNMKKLIIVCFMTLFCFGVVQAAEQSSCISCHGNKAEMEKLGYPQLYLDPVEVEKEVNMGEVACEDCHMGNPAEMTAEKAHEGMPRPFYAAAGKTLKYQAVGREVTNYDPIQPKGKERFKFLMRKPDPQQAKEKGIAVLAQLYYHDHDPETMAYDPSVAEKTCGKCHENEVKEYNVSGMGLNKYQRGFTNFSDLKPGPQNCGAWFGDNHDKIGAELAVEYPKAHGDGSARGCNKCHASCNDCHYKGYEKSNARHVYQKDPEPLSCYGSGKGTICHAGPMDRRRGAGYMREEFAFPIHELAEDVHAKNGVTCNDCHKMESHSYGHLSSQSARESCKNCHEEIYNAALESPDHGNVDCTSCHIQAVGAYQFTFWGPGKQEAQVKALAKHKEYYGTRSQPTLVKHPERGVWIPMKPYPMGVLNMKDDVKGVNKLILREIEPTMVKGNAKIGEQDFTLERKPDEVNDMYIMNGTYKLKKNNKMLAWIQMDKMSHSIGEARNCDSCHSSHDQIATSWWTYDASNDVKKPFNGSYIIRGTKKGLFFTDWKYETPEPAAGMDTEDFMPFINSGNVWDTKGIDFSIPFDDKKYADARSDYELLYGKLHGLEQQYAKDQAKLDTIKLARKILPHNPKKAAEMVSGF